MLELFAIILLVCVLYLVSVGAYSYFADISIQDARGRIVSLIKEIFGFTKQEVMYDVCIGLDEGVPNANVIDKTFEPLADIFYSYYYSNFYTRENVLCYVFTISPTKKEMDADTLDLYVGSICDKIVHDYLHTNNPYVGKIKDLVVTEIIDDILRVYVATTNNALKLLAIKKANMKLNKNRIQAEQNQQRQGTIEV